jgi:protease II
VNVYESERKTKVIDPYDWLRTGYSQEDENHFVNREQMFTKLMLFKYDLLTKLLWREQDDIYKNVPQLVPVKIGKNVYYRRIDNPADFLTLYRFPIEHLPSELDDAEYEAY